MAKKLLLYLFSYFNVLQCICMVSSTSKFTLFHIIVEFSICSSSFQSFVLWQFVIVWCACVDNFELGEKPIRPWIYFSLSFLLSFFLVFRSFATTTSRPFIQKKKSNVNWPVSKKITLLHLWAEREKLLSKATKIN